MYKNLIKKGLNDIMSEAASHPGISITSDVLGKEKKINQEYYDEVEDKVEDITKQSEKDGKDSIVPPKVNVNDKDGTKKYHDEIEIGNDNSDLKYDMIEVPERFIDRATKAIEGDTTLGNGKGANAEASWGASSDDFGKNLVKTKKERIKDMSQPPVKGGGTNGKMAGVTHQETALGVKGTEKGVTTQFTTKKNDATTEGKIYKKNELLENNKNKKSENKMKRLRFKSPFNGKDNALKLIPESYKVDNKVFEMTDGNETYKVRWEENSPVVLQESNQQFVNEDMNKIKHLMGYKSENTLGIVIGNARIDEDEIFVESLNKIKTIITEGEKKK